MQISVPETVPGRQKSKMSAGPRKKKNLNLHLMEKLLEVREEFLRKLEEGRVEAGFFYLFFRYEIQ